jgi:hypothetical protein
MTTSPVNVNPQLGAEVGDTLKLLFLTAAPLNVTADVALKFSQAFTLREPVMSNPQLGKLLGVIVK